MSELSNFERIGFLPRLLDEGFDPMTNKKVVFPEVMGVARHYQVFSGPNGEGLWLSHDDEGYVIAGNPMFQNGTLFHATLDKSLDGEEPWGFFECEVHLSVLEKGEVATRMQALMVNLGSIGFEDKKSLFGKTKQFVVPFHGFDSDEFEVRIAIFSIEIEHFENEDVFFAQQVQPDIDASESEPKIQFGSTSFLPSGMLPNEEGQTGPFGIGTGPVKSFGTAKSVFGGSDYHWAVVGAIGGDFGVVRAPEDGLPATEGGYLSHGG